MQAPLKNTNGTWCKCDKEEAQLFCSHLSEVFQPYSDLGNNTFTESTLLLSFSPQVKFNVLLNFFRKTPGIDLITAEVAPERSRKALIHLTHILNAILRLFYFPLQWKTSVVILIPKPGNSSGYSVVLPFNEPSAFLRKNN